MNARALLHTVIVVVAVLALAASAKSRYMLGATCILLGMVVVAIVIARLFIPGKGD